MNQQLTERFVRDMKPPSKGQQIIFEPDGFGVRITSKGTRAFILDYRFKGTQRRIKIARYPILSVDAARDEARDLLARIVKERKPEGGRDPMHTRKVTTVEDLAHEYMEWARGKRERKTAKRASSLREDERMLDRFIKPQLGKRKVAEVNREDIEDLAKAASRSVRFPGRETRYQANRVLALASTMFSLAVRWNMRPNNPALRSFVGRFEESKRQEWLKSEQLKTFKAALDAHSCQESANAMRLLVLTGARSGEVLRGEWNHIDLARGVWSKPSHHTKENRFEHVPLSEEAIALLRRMSKHKSGPYLFLRGEGTRTTLKYDWLQVCKAAGLATQVREVKDGTEIIRWKSRFRPHDLRHTFASHLVSEGESLHGVGKVIGHSQASTTEGYSHLADERQRAVVNHFGKIWRGVSTDKKKRALKNKNKPARAAKKKAQSAAA